MAKIMKFKHSAVVNQLRHVLREVANPANINIDPTRSVYNYILSPDRGMSAYSFYMERKSQLYCFGRDDLKTLAGWVLTVPHGLSSEQQQAFFFESYLFMEGRYDRDNTVLAAVHYDESRPHLHFLFIPAVPDLKRGGEKVCANDLITPAELRDFHPALQKHLKSVGVHASILHDIDSVPNDIMNYKSERKFEEIIRKVRDKK